MFGKLSVCLLLLKAGSASQEYIIHVERLLVHARSYLTFLRPTLLIEQLVTSRLFESYSYTKSDLYLLRSLVPFSADQEVLTD